MASGRIVEHACGRLVIDGQPCVCGVQTADVAAMTMPVRCKHCGHVHDAAKVTVEQRFADCSCWRCPGCKVLIDDRPISWGGSAIRLNKDGSER